jgi:hypothetical protein
MPTISHNEIHRRVALDGLDTTVRFLSEALESKQLKPEDFSIRKLFEATVVNSQGEQVGRDVLAECFDPSNANGKSMALSEAAGAVSSDAFNKITGQVMYSKIMAASQSEAFTVTNLIPTVPTTLSGERIPGISGIGDQAQVVAEGQSYPLAGVGEDYIDTPQTTKRGEIVAVTKEAVFFDRTGLLLMRASKVGESLGINKEKRAINCLIDQNTTAHRYKWRDVSYATYQTSTPFINKKTSNGLVDWSNIDGAEQLLANMTDPNTGEPMVVMADTIIVTPQNYNRAAMALTATGVNVQAGGFATTGNLSQTVTMNPVGKGPYSGTYKIVSSRFIPPQLATDTDWFLGAPSSAFAYMENWGITVTQAPAGSSLEFNNDIVYQYKASERGAYATLEPRLMVWNVA